MPAPTDRPGTTVIALVCSRWDSRHRTHCAEWTWWDTWELALDAHRELTPCHRRCVGDHLLAGLDEEGRWRVRRADDTEEDRMPRTPRLAGERHTAPMLPLAACIPHPALFSEGPDDEPRAELRARVKAARTVCAGCPELGPCRAWLDSLPEGRRPTGSVVAGHLVTRRTPTRKETDR